MTSCSRSEFWVEGKLRILALGLSGGVPAQSREIWIAPDHGMNLCRFMVNGRHVIDFTVDGLLHDFSGTPLLYPTPNRVRDGVFTWNGRDYVQQKRGERVLTHGLVYNEPFSVDRILSQADTAAVEGHIDFVEGAPWFAAFPFPHRLLVRYTLGLQSLRFQYRIVNRGSERIPYGIALHPYFQRLAGEAGTRLRVPFRKVYENEGESRLPTGRLLDAAACGCDLADPVPVGERSLDTVYTMRRAREDAWIDYDSLGLRLRLKSSAEFTHMVVYTPPGERFFCLESQTCATDAHNLYEKGFRAESGLRFVEPGGTAQGNVTAFLEWPGK